MKADEKKVILLQKVSSGSKKLEEMKARITKKVDKKQVEKKPVKELPAPRPKIVIKPKKLSADKKEESDKPAGVPGLAGGVKIGGGLKQKLSSLKKPPVLPSPAKKEEENAAEN